MSERIVVRRVAHGDAAGGDGNGVPRQRDVGSGGVHVGKRPLHGVRQEHGGAAARLVQ